MNTCGELISDEMTDYVCTLPHAHAGAHNWVDAMGLDHITEDGEAVYREGWNYAR